MRIPDDMLRRAWVAYEMTTQSMSYTETGHRSSVSTSDLMDALARLELEARLRRERLALEKEGA